jgi:pimeloyl-ACP methyl ester carboxylesterase
MTADSMTEHRVPRHRGSIHVRDFPGKGAAFVLLHGFPDNSHIYDDLIPHLVSAGRRTVTIDFLGFGSSDKPEGVEYRFAQQLGDVEAVVDALKLERVVLVGHDAGGPAAVNFALKHPNGVGTVVLMNAFYGEAPGLLVPELIELFSHKPLKALARHFLVSPQQFAWLVEFQRELMLGDAAPAKKKSTLPGFARSTHRQQLPSAAQCCACVCSNDLATFGRDRQKYGPCRRTPPVGRPFRTHLGQERSISARLNGSISSISGSEWCPSCA